MNVDYNKKYTNECNEEKYELYEYIQKHFISLMFLK